VMIDRLSAGFGNQLLRSDPIRIIEAVITGVSFLGAGTIIRQRSDPQVEGLTTAASILLAAALGICVALSQLALGVGVTILVLVTLRSANVLKDWLERHQS
jgi:putative Mg2+ transporter-C (MgtC) family protein